VSTYRGHSRNKVGGNLQKCNKHEDTGSNPIGGSLKAQTIAAKFKKRVTRVNHPFPDLVLILESLKERLNLDGPVTQNGSPVHPSAPKAGGSTRGERSD